MKQTSETPGLTRGELRRLLAAACAHADCEASPCSPHRPPYRRGASRDVHLAATAATRHDLILAPARMDTAFDRVLQHQI